MYVGNTTPALVMDLDRVATGYVEMTSALPGLAVHYAMKCNPYRPILERLNSLGSGFEIASAHELDDLLDIGVPPVDLLFSNPVKMPDHIAYAYAAGVRQFAFDSATEAKKLAVLAPGAAVYVRLAALTGSSDVPSEGKFGVDAQMAGDLLLAARELGLRPIGVAFHVGSQMTDPQAWHAPLSAVKSIMERLATEDLYLDIVNLGGGFPARYAVAPPPLTDYGAVIAAGLRALPYAVQAVIEPGRALAAEAGTLIATVIGTATRAGRRWVHLDVGAFNGLMESLETRNQLRFPVSDSLNNPARELYHLTGPTCDSQDTIMYDVELSMGLAAGDRVYIESAGAYTSVYASRFNGFHPPLVSHEARQSFAPASGVQLAMRSE